MKRKLWALNLALAALIAAAGWRLRTEWVAAKARERAVLRQAVKPAPPPPFTPLPAPRPMMPATYGDIAQKMLFAKDRNPVVIVETAPPPPPKPMPPLPLLHGVMNLGDGPTAIMSEKAGAQHRDIHTGQQFGEFKLLAVNSQEIVLEWDGKEVRRKVEDLIDRSAQKAPESDSRTPAAAPARPAPALVQAPAGPGAEIGGGAKSCVPGDNSPAGTVVDGMRKVVSQTPFGQGCRWEPVK